MEGSYRPNYVQIEYSVLCNLNDTSDDVSRNFKNGLLCIRTVNYELWNNFGGNQPHSEKIFKIQKRVIRIITNSRDRDSCRELFKKLEIMSLYSQHIFPLSKFVIKINIFFSTNYQIHSVHTRFKTNLHPPIANFTKF